MKRSNITNKHELPVILSVDDLAHFLRVSRAKAYDMTRRKGFPAVREGRRIFIPRDALLAWLERTAMENDGQPCA